MHKISDQTGREEIAAVETKLPDIPRRVPWQPLLSEHLFVADPLKVTSFMSARALHASHCSTKQRRGKCAVAIFLPSKLGDEKRSVPLGKDVNQGGLFYLDGRWCCWLVHYIACKVEKIDSSSSSSTI